MRKINLNNDAYEELMERVREELKTKDISGTKVTLTFDLNVPLKPEEKIEVILSSEANRKIDALVGQCSTEIGFHGTVNRSEDGKTYEIEDIYVFPQFVTGATVTPDATEYAMWKDELPDEVFNNLRFHGHSHVNMSCSPSGVDTTYQQTLLNNVEDYYIFGIFNKKGEFYLIVYDVLTNTLYEKDDIVFKHYLREEESWAKEEIEKHIKKQTVVTAVPSNIYAAKSSTYGNTSANKDKDGYSGYYQNLAKSQYSLSFDRESGRYGEGKVYSKEKVGWYYPEDLELVD